MRSLMLVGGCFFLGVLAFAAWLQAGDLGVLVPADPSRPRVETRLWVVDVDGATYVRIPTSDAVRLDPLLAGNLRFQRDGATVAVRAVPVDDARTRLAVEQAMQDKYGVRELFFGSLHGEGRSFPIRLEPTTTTASSR